MRRANAEIKFNNGTSIEILLRDGNTINTWRVSGVCDEETVADISQWTGEGGAVEGIPFTNHRKWLTNFKMLCSFQQNQLKIIILRF